MTRAGIVDVVASLARNGVPVRLTAYDGSAAGPEDSPIKLHIANERAAAYLMTAPGDLGLARAYVAGDLELEGVHPGNPYDALVFVQETFKLRRPTPAEVVSLLRTVGLDKLKPPPPPPQERLPRWRRTAQGVRHSLTRDQEAITHHYNVSNTFYEWVLGPSMTYSCAVFATHETSLEDAQFAKYDLVARKLDLQPGQRLLDIGCGWGGMVRHAAKHYGVKALGVTLSSAQAEWARAKVAEEGLEDLVEIRLQDYRKVPETGFDGVCSIGMSEHLGVANYPRYFTHLGGKLREGGRMLNHCITRPHNRRQDTGPFIDRYIFPDGELTGVGNIVVAAQDAGLEVQHVENLREHYALTLAGWNRNLVAHWEDALAEVGAGTARTWGLYIAGSRLGFERNTVELHQVLMTRTAPNGDSQYPLRPTW